MRVFIAEDNAIIALVLRDLVEAADCEFCGSADTHEASLRSCIEGAVDVALVDIDLRDGSKGWKLVTALNEHGIRSIIVTGNAVSEEDVARAGVLASFTKPIDEMAVIKLLQTAKARSSVD